jgi:hypothetical protein
MPVIDISSSTSNNLNYNQNNVSEFSTTLLPNDLFTSNKFVSTQSNSTNLADSSSTKYTSESVSTKFQYESNSVSYYTNIPKETESTLISSGFDSTETSTIIELVTSSASISNYKSTIVSNEQLTSTIFSETTPFSNKYKFKK